MKNPKAPKSIYNGVSWSTKYQKWVAQIWIPELEEKIHLGIGHDPRAMALVYDRYALKMGLPTNILKFKCKRNEKFI